MEVILLKDIAKVGKRFSVVSVSEGYANHFLIPKGLAKVATANAKKSIEVQKEKAGAQRQAHEESVNRDIKTLEGKTVLLQEKVNDKGSLFAGIHANAVQNAIASQFGISLPLECIVLAEDPIKHAGDTEVQLVSGKAKGTIIVSISPVSK